MASASRSDPRKFVLFLLQPSTLVSVNIYEIIYFLIRIAFNMKPQDV